MSDDPHYTMPFNPLPPILWIAGAVHPWRIEIVLSLGASEAFDRRARGGGVAQRGDCRYYGFSGPALRWMLETGQWPFTYVMRFVHLSVCLALRADGHGVLVWCFFWRWARWWREVFGVLGDCGDLLWLSAMVGALVYYAVDRHGALCWLGGFPAGYGLIGAFTMALCCA